MPEGVGYAAVSDPVDTTCIIVVVIPDLVHHTGVIGFAMRPVCVENEGVQGEVQQSGDRREAFGHFLLSSRQPVHVMSHPR